MYYLIRILALLIITICYIVLRKRNTQKALKRSKKAVFIKIAIIALVILLVFIPYEAPFVRFDSAYDSVKYSTTKFNTPLYTIETEKTAFSAELEDSTFSYHSITKYKDKYGYCDQDSHILLGSYKHEIIQDENYMGSFLVKKLENKKTREKCYIIVFGNLLDEINNNKEKEDIIIYDENNTPIEKMFSTNKWTAFAVVVDCLDESTSFIFNGKTYELN